jgi:hypothetical protein
MKSIDALFLSVLIMIMILSGCVSHSDGMNSADEAKQASEALSDPFNALGTDDESQEFDDSEIAAVEGEEEAVEDVFAPADKEGADLPTTPDCNVYSLFMRWGQLTGLNRDASGVTNWTGTISANIGTLAVIRKVAFDNHDLLSTRTDPKIIEFESYTKPHFDGLRIRYEVCDSDEASLGVDEVATITFSALGAPLTKSYTVSELVELNDLVDGIGENNDRFHALAVKKSDLCQGTIQGRWIQKNDQYGIFKGVVVSTNGLPVGHIKGFFGEREGENKLVAKIISRTGRFGGILKGSFESNNFTADVYSKVRDEIGSVDGSFVLPSEQDEVGTFSANYKLDCAQDFENE